MPRLNNCTAQLKDGSFCDGPSMDGAPFPICRHHAMKAFLHMKELLDVCLHGLRLAASAERQPAKDIRTPVVYYIRMGEYIKIGTTISLDQRVAGLRGRMQDVLATEPGGYELERRRHRQFEHLRQGRREDFRPAPELMEHIRSIRG